MCEYKAEQDAKKAQKRYEARAKKCENDPYQQKKAQLPKLKQKLAEPEKQDHEGAPQPKPEEEEDYNKPGGINEDARSQSTPAIK